MSAVRALRPTQGLPPRRRLRWQRAYRVISSRYPPIDLFERIADPTDWDALFELEQMTNPRVREAVGEISVVPPEERVSGPGASWVMAAFTHLGRPSRFSDGSFGVYYAARHMLTSIHETAFHFARFLCATQEPSGTTLEMRVLISETVDAYYRDLRSAYPELHDADSYQASQQFGHQAMLRGDNGIVYDSVRHPIGQCLAILRPKAIPIPHQGPHLRYRFDGATIDRWFEMGTEAWQTL